MPGYNDNDYADINVDPSNADAWAEALGLATQRAQADEMFALRLNDALKANDVAQVGKILHEVTVSTLPPNTRHRVNEIRGRIRSLAAELAKLYAIPKEPFFVDQPTIITFVKTWGGQRPYTYAAIRVNDKWWISGNRAESYPFDSWELLWEFINRKEERTPMILIGQQYEQLS